MPEKQGPLSFVSLKVCHNPLPFLSTTIKMPSEINLKLSQFHLCYLDFEMHLLLILILLWNKYS